MSWTKTTMRQFVTSVSWVFTCSNCGHEESVDEGTMPTGWKFDAEDLESLCDLCSGEGSWVPLPHIPDYDADFPFPEDDDPFDGWDQ